jgi:hypothetical protein
MEDPRHDAVARARATAIGLLKVEFSVKQICEGLRAGGRPFLRRAASALMGSTAYPMIEARLMRNAALWRRINAGKAKEGRRHMSSVRFVEYSGMSYERASREAARLIDGDGWFKNFERLTALREIMIHHNMRTVIAATA